MSKQLILRRKPIEPVYQTKLGKLFCGDVLSVLDSLPSESVQCVVTSPPYWGLRDYLTGTWVGGNPNCTHKPLVSLRSTRPKGKLVGSTRTVDEGTVQKKRCHCGAIRVDNQIGIEETPSEYVEKMTLIFTKIRRVLKSDGTLWLNLGDSYWSNTLSRTDVVEAMWGNRPASEIEKGRDREKIPKVNHRGGLGKAPKGLKPKDLVGIPWSVAFSLRDSGWYLRQDIIWHKPNPMPESVSDRCTKAHEYIFLMSKSGKYYYNQDSIREKAVNPKSWNNKEHAIPKGPEGGTRAGLHKYVEKENRNKRSVWTINSEPYPDSHFATFPTKLIEPCIRAGSKEGDILLDPFMGSGTTAYMCEFLNRKWIGIELNPKYCDLAKKRIDQEALKPKLF